MSRIPKCDFCKTEERRLTNITVAPPRTGSLFIYRLCDACYGKVQDAIDEVQDSIGGRR